MPLHTPHLTTGQFSAFLDQQLSASELSRCQTHLNICVSCQQQFTELQQTVLLVRALPRAPLPRSFLLSAEVLAEEKTDAPPHLVGQAHNRIIAFPRYIHTTMSITSTLVAALGLFFILSGVLMTAPPTAEIPQVSTPFAISVNVKAPSSSSKVSKYPSLASAPPASGYSGGPVPPASAPQTSGNLAPPAPQAPGNVIPPAYPGGAASAPQAPAYPGDSANTYPSNTPQQQPLLSLIRPFFDVDTSQGHLGIGLLLFIAGIVGVVYYSVTTRKKYGKRER